MGESPGAVEARAPVGARPESAMRRPGGASTGGKGSERAIVSGRASAADVVSRIIIHTVCVSASLSSQIWIQQPTGLREKRPSDFHLIHFSSSASRSLARPVLDKVDPWSSHSS